MRSPISGVRPQSRQRWRSAVSAPTPLRNSTRSKSWVGGVRSTSTGSAPNGAILRRWAHPGPQSRHIWPETLRYDRFALASLQAPSDGGTREVSHGLFDVRHDRRSGLVRVQRVRPGSHAYGWRHARRVPQLRRLRVLAVLAGADFALRARRESPDGRGSG